MKVMNAMLLAGLAAMSLTLQACKGSSTKANKDAKSLEKLLESDGSGNWELIKADTIRVKGYAIFKGPDSKYYAFNTAISFKGMTKADYLAATTAYSNLRKDTRTDSYYGAPNWKVPNSCPTSPTTDVTCYSLERDENGYPLITYTYYASSNYTWERERVYVDSASGLVFEVGDNSSKDLEAVSAAIESMANDSLRDQLVMGYGLSESRASEIASLARSWQNLERSRAMTAKDLTQFQTKVFGFDLNTMKKAAVKAANGNSKDYDQLIKKAAKLNNVSPEQAKEIFNSLVD